MCMFFIQEYGRKNTSVKCEHLTYLVPGFMQVKRVFSTIKLNAYIKIACLQISQNISRKSKDFTKIDNQMILRKVLFVCFGFYVHIDTV
jgi:hypothetical protein